MCYYNGQKVAKDETIRLKSLSKKVAEFDFLNRDLIDGFAYGNIAVLQPTESGNDFNLSQMEWGFIPDTWYGKPLDTREKVENWRRDHKDASGKFIKGITTLNAMGEEMLLPHKIFRSSALERRCLVLSTGFFEWMHHYPKNKRTGEPLKTAIKIPHYIYIKDKPYFFMAGIYKPWTDKVTGETVNTVSIGTTKAPEGHLMAKVHNSKFRMPSILNEDMGWEWMFENPSEDRITEIVTTQYPSELMGAWTIDKSFKTSGNPKEAVVWSEYPEVESEL